MDVHLVQRRTSGGPLFINAISLDMAAPFTVTQTPPGWAVDTDNASYVLWYAADVQLPYPNHIAPGALLTPFQIQSDQVGWAGGSASRRGTTKRTKPTARR